MELDSLEVKITGTATKAINSVDKLINQLTRLSTSLATVNGSSLSSLANGVSQLGSAMQNMNAGTADFTRLAKNITKIGSVDSAALANTATSLEAVTKAVASISAIPQNATQVTEFAKSLGKLGSKSIENATVNIPKLGNALNGLMTTLSRAPNVSSNVIAMTNALANLASQGSKVGTSSNSLQKSLYGVSTSARTATKSSWSLASAIGKFYATYFMVIRGSKKLIEAIKSTTDYIEAFNYQAVAFGKIGSEWDKDYEKYGYDNATAYAESFQNRVNDTLGKLSGLKVNVQGGLLEESGAKNLGLNIQEITQYASQLASVTNSLGQTGEATTAITKSMTMLAGDISSLFNVDYSTVAQNLQSGLIGQSRALYKYGIDITNATLATYAYNLGISKSVSEMTQMEKQQLRVLAILDQSKVSWGDLANTINSPSNMLHQLAIAVLLHQSEKLFHFSLKDVFMLSPNSPHFSLVNHGATLVVHQFAISSLCPNVIVSITPSIKLGKSSNGAFIRYAIWSNIDISIFSPVNFSLSQLPKLNPAIAATIPPTIPAPIVKPISVAVPAPIIVPISVVSNPPIPDIMLPVPNDFKAPLILVPITVTSFFFKTLPKPVNFNAAIAVIKVVSIGAAVNEPLHNSIAALMACHNTLPRLENISTQLSPAKYSPTLCPIVYQGTSSIAFANQLKIPATRLDVSCPAA